LSVPPLRIGRYFEWKSPPSFATIGLAAPYLPTSQMETEP
jgi:hypothetical protein